MRTSIRTFGGGLAASLGALALSACGGQKAVYVPPPPAPALVTIPPRPYPPMGAPANMFVPAVGADGVRQTVNANLSEMQTVWNLRSAYNVAALNCLRPEHAEILTGYRAFLKNNAKALSNANRAVDNEFRRKHGARFVAPREAYMTQVYNYFATPPTLSAFCDAALAMSRASLEVKPADLPAFSAAELPKLEAVFESFFRAYEQYRIDAATWDARYAQRPSVVVPASSSGVAMGGGTTAQR